ncbi:DUF1707 domain-containing protein [Acidiferrimicrobium sp. IK]|uniref:DUF1707 SHOCT-like domain-containing protein n=1 Tax=Acidiferrimicrobium sp. IK TaxID=2871700 RepID=UPI0021CB1D4A|nr:DUF1707 domain-containing protein [Acidiferrimicrobium sp. IK]MCU4187052.1 DUF1707 domain-containing protein [Acidiferrimicrobium sp. IK]
MRISDADRQRVVEELGQHLSAGRLDLDAYSARIEEVMGAETLADLDHARRDLPFMRVIPPGDRRGSAGALPGPPGAKLTGGPWRARAVLILVMLLVVVGVLVAVFAQAAYVGILIAGWVLGVALGRASPGRR